MVCAARPPDDWKYVNRSAEQPQLTILSIKLLIFV
jgi:hypothetical protein